ncbi:hypothetical protein Hanom_Chr07g00656181 [Helianthus anomalus]
MSNVLFASTVTETSSNRLVNVYDVGNLSYQWKIGILLLHIHSMFILHMI